MIFFITTSGDFLFKDGQVYKNEHDKPGPVLHGSGII